MSENRKRRHDDEEICDDDDNNNEIPKSPKTYNVTELKNDNNSNDKKSGDNDDDVKKSLFEENINKYNDMVDEKDNNEGTNDYLEEDINVDNAVMNHGHLPREDLYHDRLSDVNDDENESDCTTILSNNEEDDDNKILTSAIRRRKPVETILELINLYPLSVKTETLIGKYYPLHISCMCYEDDDMIMKLLDSYPLAIRKKDITGRYPLHYACEYRQTENVVIKFIEMFPLALQKQDDRGRIPLHSAFQGAQTDNVIIRLINSFPMSVRITNDTPNINSIGYSYGSALHYACIYHQFVAVIEKIIEIYPEALQETYNFGKFPIHIAIEAGDNEPSFDVIKLLMNCDPLVFQRRTIENCNSPLHVACIEGWNTLVEYMIQQPNCFINIKNAIGETPLCQACIHGHHDVVEKLLQHPDIHVNAPDNSGESPLNKYLDIRIFEQLLRHPYIVVNPKDLDKIKEEIKYSMGIGQRSVDIKAMKKLVEEILHKRRWQAFQYLLNS